MTVPQPTIVTILRLVWQGLKEGASYGGALAAAVLAVGGFFVDDLSFEMKVLLITVVTGLALVGVLGIRWRAGRMSSESARAGAAEAEVQQLRARLDESAPGAVLEAVGAALFVKPGGWRLTLFVIEQFSDKSWCLSPLATRASSEVYEATPHGDLPLKEGLLREILDVDATDPLQPFSNESANLPDREVEPVLWRERHAQIIPGTPTDATMPTRKFGWTVMTEPTSRRTLVLLSESVLADGIQLDVTRSQLLAPTIALISRMLGVRTRSELDAV